MIVLSAVAALLVNVTPPITGEPVNVGVMLPTNEPLPVVVVATAANKLALVGVASQVATPAPRLAMLEIGGTVVDRSMQVLGGLGITDDTIVAKIFREVRPFRIYDGPSEVHRWSIAQRVLRELDLCNLSSYTIQK